MSDEAKAVEKKDVEAKVEAGVDEKPIEGAAEAGTKTEDIQPKRKHDETKKKHKRRHRSKYRDLPEEPEPEEEDEEDPEDDVADDRLVVEDDEQDDLTGIQSTNILSGRRTRGKVVDYSKVSAELDAELGPDEDDDEDDDADFQFVEKK